MVRPRATRTCFETEKRRIDMSAKDYKICPALFNAYIAKVSKRNPNMMLEDRRVIVAFGDDDYALLHRSNNSNVLTDKNGFCNYGYKEVLAWLPIPKFEPKK